MPSVVDDSEYDPPKNNKRGEARISQPLRFEVASADSGGFLGIAFGWTFDIASCRYFGSDARLPSRTFVGLLAVMILPSVVAAHDGFHDGPRSGKEVFEPGSP